MSIFDLFRKKKVGAYPTYLYTEEDYWPIRQLKAIGRLPIQYNTWIGEGHTISSNEKDSPYAKNTAFCSSLL